MPDFDERLYDLTDAALIVRAGKRADIVVAAPHHAPLGQPTLPSPTHSVSDENTGFIAQYISDWLDCACVIQTNARVDPNKTLDTPYSRQISNWAPTVLVEIHGHGGVKARHDIEISSGSLQRSWAAELLANRVRSKMNDTKLAGLSISGRYNEIYFKASSTATIANAVWLGLHVELPPQIRKGTPHEPVPAVGYSLAQMIATEVHDALPLFNMS